MKISYSFTCVFCQQLCLYCLIFYLYFQSKQLLFFCINLFLLCHQEILSRGVLFVEQHSYKLQLCYLLVKYLHRLGNVLDHFNQRAKKLFTVTRSTLAVDLNIQQLITTSTSVDFLKYVGKTIIIML